MPTDSERALAIFVDFDNIAQGFRRNDRFDIQRVLKRMVEKGKIVAKKTYADWSRYGQYTALLHEAAFELVEIPKRSQTGKNSADIRLCVDAMDLAYAKPHIDTFVIVSGDSDFTPLVSKLKEMGKHVIGMGMQASTSDLLRDNCDEFIYYEDLEVEKAETPRVDLSVSENKRKALELLIEACVALRRENKEKLWASMIKETMKRKKPSFNETYHGFRTFSALLEDAQAQGLVELERDEQRGTYVVTRFGDEVQGYRPPARPSREPREPERERGRGRRRADEAEPAAGRRSSKRDYAEAGTRAAPARPPRQPEDLAGVSFGEPRPRDSRFQAFSEFEQEATEFLGPKKGAGFEEDFPGFGGPVRPAGERTSDEVMAAMSFETKPPAQAAESAPAEETDVLEEDKGDKRKRRGRRGRGKGRPTAEPAAAETPMPAEVEPAATPAPAGELEPIAFDDVPFAETSARGRAPAAAEPEALEPPTEHREVEFSPESAPPAKQKEPAGEPRSFGFGIFDE